MIGLGLKRFAPSYTSKPSRSIVDAGLEMSRGVVAGDIAAVYLDASAGILVRRATARKPVKCPSKSRSKRLIPAPCPQPR